MIFPAIYYKPPLIVIFPIIFLWKPQSTSSSSGLSALKLPKNLFTPSTNLAEMWRYGYHGYKPYKLGYNCYVCIYIHVYYIYVYVYIYIYCFIYLLICLFIYIYIHIYSYIYIFIYIHIFIYLIYITPLSMVAYGGVPKKKVRTPISSSPHGWPWLSIETTKGDLGIPYFRKPPYRKIWACDR